MAWSGALDPVIQKEVVERDLYATAVLFRQPQTSMVVFIPMPAAFLASHRWWWPYCDLPAPSVSISKRMCSVHDQQGNPHPPQGYLLATRKSTPFVKTSVKLKQVSRSPISRCFRYHPGSAEHQPAVQWRPQSTYIGRPPIWEGALAGERSLKGIARTGGGWV